MSTNSGSSSSSSSGGGGGSSNPRVYDYRTGTWSEPSDSDLRAAIASRSVAPMPVAQRFAPAGASLGQNSSGASIVSQGGGRASSDGGQTSFDLPKSSAYESSSSQINYLTTGDGKSTGARTGQARSIYESSNDGGGNGRDGAIDTKVTQQPAASTEGPESTTISSSPRSDYSVVLAGQVGRRPDRSPARSNNFVSLVGGAGGLGRRAESSKRTLIGGA